MATGLFDRYGRVKLAQIVSSFYRDVLRSPRLAPFLADVNMTGLMDHQTAFMSTVMGGPPSFTADEIYQAHRSLGITDEDFDEMLRLLEESLNRHGVEPEDTAAVVAGYRALRRDVVSRLEATPSV